MGRTAGLRNMLVVPVVLMLLCGCTEGLMMTKCELMSQLEATFPKLPRVISMDIISRVVCTAEQSSHFNTSLVTVIDHFIHRSDVDDSSETDKVIPTEINPDVNSDEHEDEQAEQNGDISRERSGEKTEGSSEELSGNSSEDTSGDGSGILIDGKVEFSGIGSGNGSGDLSEGKQEFSGHGSGEGSVDLFGVKPELSGYGSGEGSGGLFEGKPELSGYGSGEGSGGLFEGKPEFSGYGSGEGSGGLFEGKPEFSGYGSGEGSGGLFEGKPEFSGHGSVEGSGGLLEGTLEFPGYSSGDSSGDLFEDKPEFSRGTHEQASGDGSLVVSVEGFGDLFEGKLDFHRDSSVEGSGVGSGDGSDQPKVTNEVHIDGFPDPLINPITEIAEYFDKPVVQSDELFFPGGNEASEDSSEEMQNNVEMLYGIFQLSDHVACKSGSNQSLNLCKLDCNALTDDDVTDDIACLKTLHEKLTDMRFTEECLSLKPSVYFSKCS